ncbi:hypothetical protein B0A55_03294 [Friedmanniomyces simplex]|uniref:Uncharacterized protein n=1 Tax=Friedmanniomyces simplex TaxID=329884 RepID=A0A4U0XVE3_9PEZI|nr:hypothetical protein B0A55_03294 [Friedmanniomyces simplex]
MSLGHGGHREGRSNTALLLQQSSETTTELLDTLPDPFNYEPRILHDHFAHYDFNAVRDAEGKHQTAFITVIGMR